jgi:transposase
VAQRQRRFTPEFKEDVAQLYLSGERTVAELCRDFDLGDTAVRRWIRQAEASQLGREVPATGRNQLEEIEALRKENTTLRMERDVLKRAMAFFARETR